MKVTITDESQQLFAATFLLDHMARKEVTFDTLATDGSEDFTNTLQWLLTRGYVAFDKSHHYALTTKGERAADDFATRYQTILTYFDIFGHVDLETGNFAYEEYQNFDSTAQWQRYLENDRWEDVRLPLIQHLGGSAIELVFHQFVREGRIDTTTAGWEYEIAQGLQWGAILEICNSALTAEQFSYDNGGERIPGEHVLDDIVAQGFDLLRELYSDDIEICSNLAVWYPQHGVANPALGSASSPQPVWQTTWNL